jgi:hypothetical protein
VVNLFDNPRLHQYLSSSQDAAIVFIGPRPPSHRESQPDCQYHAKTLDELTASATLQPEVASMAESAGGGAVADAAPTRSLTAVMQLESNDSAVDSTLGKAVRMFPNRLLVCCSDRTFADDQFFAFGFRRLDGLCESLASGEEPCWYEYRMSDYKSPPDWLNARFWANPERFDLPEEPDLYCDEEE